MAEPSILLRKLASALPDIPRWVETRSMLLSGRCEIFGYTETGALSFAVGSPEMELISVVGFPTKEAILEAVAANSGEVELLATPENGSHVAEALPDWADSPARLHMLGEEIRFPEISDNVRMLEASEIEALANLPFDLKEELAVACCYSPVAATIVEGIPVSFCYAGSETESLWDVSIDTLAGYRNKGCAAACVAYMIERMRRQNKHPVWGALETNAASLRLAAKLGFVAVDTIMVFQHKL